MQKATDSFLVLFIANNLHHPVG